MRSEVLPFGFDSTRHDVTHDRDRQIEMLERQTAPPKSEADLMAEANAHPYVWELARRRMYRMFDYGALDRALEQLRDADHSAYRALHAVYMYAWAPPSAGVYECARGLDFLESVLPDPLRAPAASEQPETRVRGAIRPEAGKATKLIRDREMRAAADAGATLAELMAKFGVSKSTVYAVVNRREAA
jgi:hypothetical protein